jgi:hypothetical protein
MCSSGCAGQDGSFMVFAAGLARCKTEEGSHESQLVEREREGVMQGEGDWCKGS